MNAGFPPQYKTTHTRFVFLFCAFFQLLPIRLIILSLAQDAPVSSQVLCISVLGETKFVFSFLLLVSWYIWYSVYEEYLERRNEVFLVQVLAKDWLVMGLHNPYIDVILSHTERAGERESFTYLAAQHIERKYRAINTHHMRVLLSKCLCECVCLKCVFHLLKGYELTGVGKS